MLIVIKVWYYFYMKYEKIVTGQFIARPNRFIAEVMLDGRVVRVHVKNTGRCRELLVPGARVYLEDFTDRMGSRKLAYSLIGVEKITDGGARREGADAGCSAEHGAAACRPGTAACRLEAAACGTVLMVNMDSQAPNKVVMEALQEGTLVLPGMGKLTLIKPEKTYGDSRFDFYLEDENGQKGFMEVKGVTLENEGVVRFPDAPTERGVKHIHELIHAHEEGYHAYALFVIQMEPMKEFRPNDDTHPAFGQALRQAKEAGVEVLAWECSVTADSLKMARPVPVRLQPQKG